MIQIRGSRALEVPLANMVSLTSSTRSKRRCSCCGAEGRLRSGCGCHGGKSHQCLLGLVFQIADPGNSADDFKTTASAAKSETKTPATASDTPSEESRDSETTASAAATASAADDAAPQTAVDANDSVKIKVSVDARGNNNIKISVKV